MTAPSQPSFRCCAIVPTRDNAATLRQVVLGIRQFLEDVIVIDDGSGPEGQAAAQTLADAGLATVLRRPRNGGKGAAVKDGLREAARRQLSHALQVDADGQHDLGDIPRLLRAARERPDALVLGAPVFDAQAPRARRIGRKITVWWTHRETGSKSIADPMCGFRVYPVQGALDVAAAGNRMDFDPEIAVRLVWAGVPVINVPTKVRYLKPEDGGVSHFRMVTDNALISWMHTRLVVRAIVRWIAGGVALSSRQQRLAASASRSDR